MQMLHSGIAETCVVQVQHLPIYQSTNGRSAQTRMNEENKMAFINDIRALETGIAEHVKVAFAEFIAHRAEARRFRKTRHELQALTNRELADLGITRSMITSVAKEAAATNV